MNWYLAKMIFSTTTGGEYQSPEFDVQMRVIKSRNEQEALMKSLAIGSEEEETFLSEIGEIVKWSFVDVAELTLLPGFQDDLQRYTQSEEEKPQPWYSYFFFILQFFL